MTTPAERMLLKEKERKKRAELAAMPLPQVGEAEVHEKFLDMFGRLDLDLVEEHGPDGTQLVVAAYVRGCNRRAHEALGRNDQKPARIALRRAHALANAPRLWRIDEAERQVLLALTLGNLAVLARQSAKPEEALGYIEEAARLELRLEAVLPELVPSVGETLVNLGSVRSATGDHVGATEALTRAISRIRSSLRKAHENAARKAVRDHSPFEVETSPVLKAKSLALATALFNVGVEYEFTNKWGLAVSAYEEAARTFGRVLGPGSAPAAEAMQAQSDARTRLLASEVLNKASIVPEPEHKRQARERENRRRAKAKAKAPSWTRGPYAGLAKPNIRATPSTTSSSTLRDVVDHKFIAHAMQTTAKLVLRESTPSSTSSSFSPTPKKLPIPQRHRFGRQQMTADLRALEAHSQTAVNRIHEDTIRLRLSRTAPLPPISSKHPKPSPMESPPSLNFHPQEPLHSKQPSPRRRVHILEPHEVRPLVRTESKPPLGFLGPKEDGEGDWSNPVDALPPSIQTAINHVSLSRFEHPKKQNPNTTNAESIRSRRTALSGAPAVRRAREPNVEDPDSLYDLSGRRIERESPTHSRPGSSASASRSAMASRARERMKQVSPESSLDPLTPKPVASAETEEDADGYLAGGQMGFLDQVQADLAAQGPDVLERGARGEIGIDEVATYIAREEVLRAGGTMNADAEQQALDRIMASTSEIHRSILEAKLARFQRN